MVCVCCSTCEINYKSFSLVVAFNTHVSSFSNKNAHCSVVAAAAHTDTRTHNTYFHVIMVYRLVWRVYARLTLWLQRAKSA